MAPERRADLTRGDLGQRRTGAVDTLGAARLFDALWPAEADKRRAAAFLGQSRTTGGSGTDVLRP